MNSSPNHAANRQSEDFGHPEDDENLQFRLIDYAFRQLAKGSVVVEIPGPLRDGRTQVARLRFEAKSHGEEHL